MLKLHAVKLVWFPSPNKCIGKYENQNYLPKSNFLFGLRLVYHNNVGQSKWVFQLKLGSKYYDTKNFKLNVMYFRDA